jgi:hypothetical protein
MKQEVLKDALYQQWPSTFDLQPKTAGERHDVIAIQYLKKQAAMEIDRLQKLINDHNANCPADWLIDDKNRWLNEQ